MVKFAWYFCICVNAWKLFQCISKGELNVQHMHAIQTWQTEMGDGCEVDTLYDYETNRFIDLGLLKFRTFHFPYARL